MVRKVTSNKSIFQLLLSLISFVTTAQSPQVPIGAVFRLRQTPAHDPVMIKQGDTYYMFCTGFGITVFSSKDLKTW